jgi:chemotaxis family two-component system response regulator Rcp1
MGPGSRPIPLNLLLIEDNLPDTLMVIEAIKKEGLPVDVYLAEDGEQAMAFIETAKTDPSAPVPQALLLDLNIPKVDGLEILSAVRSSGPLKDLPVLVVTSSDSPADRRAVATLGAGYFRKPTTYREFVQIGACIKAFLEQHGLL